MSRSIGSFPERARYVLRYIYPGSTPRNGRVIDLGELDGPSAAALPIEATMIADGVDPARWSVRVFDNFLEGWRTLGDGARDDGRGGGGEHVLEEPEREVTALSLIHI